MPSLLHPTAAFLSLAIASSAAGDSAAVDRLRRQPIGSATFAEALATARPGDCHRTDRADWIVALRATRRWWLVRQEDGGGRREWSQLRRGASQHGQRLLDGFAHSEELARQQLFCEDALPIPRTGLSPSRFVDAAVPLLRAVASRDRRPAAVRAALADLGSQLLARYDAMFGDGDPEARGDLVLLLALLNDGDLGRGAVAGQGDFVADPGRLGSLPPPTIPFVEDLEAWGLHFVRVIQGLPSDPVPEGRIPLPREPRSMVVDRLRGDYTLEPAVVPQLAQDGLSMGLLEADILDPKDTVELLRTLDGWARQVAALKRDVRGQRRLLRELEGALARGADPDETAARAERARRALQRGTADVARMQRRIQAWRTTRPWIDRWLDRGLRRAPVRDLERLRDSAGEAERTARAVVAAAVQEGAKPPIDAAPDADGLSRRLAEARRARGIVAGPVGAASRPVRERRWTGRLPRPSAWDAALLRWMTRVHPSLDELDAALLLELVARAVPELDRGGVEALVRETLDAWGTLKLRGGEGRLSDVYEPDAAADQQAEVVFVIGLPAGDEGG